MGELDLLRAELARREMARRSYYPYLALTHGAAWRDTRMARLIADTVQAFVQTDTGHAYDILVIETPPQHGKSLSVTESLPSWINGVRPEWRVIMASYNEESAERFCRRNKDKVRQYGEMLFGRRIGRIDRSTEYELDGSAGRVISRGILSGITGNPANLLLIDDPIKNRQEADSPTVRSRVWEEWQNSLKSRLQAGGKVIIIATPWHEDDLMARVLTGESNVQLLRLPVASEGKGDPLGRPEGAPLCPELGKDAAWLEQFRSAYLSDPEGGQRAWSALYMCSPRVEGGNLVHRSWWRRYDPAKVTTFASETISVDATFKGKANNDFVAITVWGKIGVDYYLRYCLNRHLDFPGTMQAIRAVRRLYPSAGTVLIEDKANGSAIIQTLQREMTGVIPVNPLGGKEARVNAVSPAIESGHVYLPQDAPWLEEYIDQWSAFPAGAHDDMIDSSTQALSRLLHASGVVCAPTDTEAEQLRRAEEQEFLSADLYDVYGVDE